MKLSKVSVSVVVPNWNGAVLMAKNLPHLVQAATFPENRIKEIIVVDDGSSDNSIEVLNEHFANSVRLIKHSTNRGFSHAVNTGVRFATGTHVCLLNSDVVPEKNFLAPTIEYLADESMFGVTLEEKGLGPAVGRFTGYLEHANYGPKNKVLDTLWISGGSGVFSREKWKELRGMDSDLLSPFYWEDVDLGYRAHKRGYRLLWVPGAVVHHNHESVINTNNFKKRYLNIIKERNELLFIWKNITSEGLFNKHKSALFNRIKNHPGYIKVLIAALLKIKVVRKRRRYEKEHSTVSDEAVFSKFSGMI